MVIDAAKIENIAREVIGWPQHREWETRDKDRRFKALFGASSEVVATLWNMIDDHNPVEGGQPKHLLWALVHLKVYGSEETHCSIVGWPTAKTFAN